MDIPNCIERPYSEYNLSNYLLLCNASDRLVTRINRCFSVIYHHKHSSVRYLIRKLDIAVTYRRFIYIRFLQRLIVDIDNAFVIDINPFT